MRARRATVAKCETDVIRMGTRGRLAVAKARGRLRGKQPKLTARQKAHLVQLHGAGDNSTSELGDLFGVRRSTTMYGLSNAPERERWLRVNVRSRVHR